MKKLTKLTLLVAGLVIVGCGANNNTPQTPRSSDPQFTQPLGPTGPSTQFFGSQSVPFNTPVEDHVLLKNVVNGVFVDVGKEDIEPTLGQMNLGQRAYHLWYTRFEFLENDGSNVKPESFTQPTVTFWKVRIILESSARPGLRYTVTGTPWFNKLGNVDYLASNKPMSGTDSLGRTVSLSFVYRDFLLWDFLRMGGGARLRNMGGGTLKLQVLGNSNPGLPGAIVPSVPQTHDIRY